MQMHENIYLLQTSGKLTEKLINNTIRKLNRWNKHLLVQG